MCWERARSKEQKGQRLLEVLSVARDLLGRRPFYAITMAEISRDLSFTRANLYKYFASREEIFLTLLAHEIRDFGERLQEKWKVEGCKVRSVENFLGLWVPALAGEELLLTLTSMAGTILEKNCSDRVLLESKRAMAEAMERFFVPILRSYFPALGVEELSRMLNYLVVTANGLFPFCGLSLSQKELLFSNGLDQMVHEFEEEYAAMLGPILHALSGMD